LIFKRFRKQPAESAPEVEEVPAELDDDENDVEAERGDARTSTGPADGPDPADAEDAEFAEGAEGAEGEDHAEDEAELDVEALDAQDWRTDGPFDVSEVGLDLDDDVDVDGVDDEADGDAAGQSSGEPARIDLGSMLVTGFPGAELRLQVSEETQQVVSVMLISDDSAIELGAYAAPRTGGFWPELREELIEAATEDGGSAALVEGPFGVELRRILPVTTPDGEQGYQPSRMWVVEGPRWLLRGIVYGQAALEDGVDGPVAPLLTAFRQVIVRRDAQAMSPGDLLPLELPRDLTAEA
jgi:hypothetical protein